MLRPSLRHCRMAGTPSRVPGILTSTLGRSTAVKRRCASFADPSLSLARCGETSMLTKPSSPAGREVHGREHVAGRAHVLDDEPVEDLLGAQALPAERLDRLVVLLATADGPLEDRRVGGHAPETVALDHLPEAATLDERPVDVVEPGALTQTVELGEPALGRGHGDHSPFVGQRPGRDVTDVTRAARAAGAAAPALRAAFRQVHSHKAGISRMATSSGVPALRHDADEGERRLRGGAELVLVVGRHVGVASRPPAGAPRRRGAAPRARRRRS